MAGNGNARGGLGWVILVIALAVPGVLFFNWWSHLKADREKAVAAKARGRVPDGGVFQSSPNAKLVNPMTPAVAPATTPPVAVAVASAPAASAGAPGVQLAAAAVPGAAALAVPGALTAPAAGAPPAGAAPAVQAPAFSSATASILPLKRDPTLSPFDQVRILEEEEAKRAAAAALLEGAKVKTKGHKPKPVVKPETLVNLQGIISNPDSGFKAIVNDEVLGVGEFIGKTGIKIVKITDLGVTFNHKGYKFSKGVSRD